MAKTRRVDKNTGEARIWDDEHPELKWQLETPAVFGDASLPTIPLEAIPPAQGAGERMSSQLDSAMEGVRKGVDSIPVIGGVEIPGVGKTLGELFPSRVENAHKLDMAEKEGDVEALGELAGHPTEDLLSLVAGANATAKGVKGWWGTRQASKLAREQNVVRHAAANTVKARADALGRAGTEAELAAAEADLTPAASAMAAHNQGPTTLDKLLKGLAWGGGALGIRELLRVLGGDGRNY